MDTKFTILRDTREKSARGWEFIKLDRCLGTKHQTLKTGDYTIDGLENEFVIERKGRITEFVNNLYQDRFWAELDRLDKFEHPYLLLEFPFEYLDVYPKFSGIPQSKWGDIKVRGSQLIKLYHEMRLAHPKLRVDFVGQSGKAYALSLFKRMADIYGKR